MNQNTHVQDTNCVSAATTDPRIVRTLQEMWHRNDKYQPLYGADHVVGTDHQKECWQRASLIQSDIGEEVFKCRRLEILDIGSSLGFFCFFFADRHAICDGYEYNRENHMLSRMLSLYNGLSPNFFNKAFDLDLAYRLQPKYDVALLLNVLHHLNRKHGIEYVQNYVRILAEKIPILYVEIPRKNENPDMSWNASLPHDERVFFAQCKHCAVEQIGISPSHLGETSRPIYRIQNKTVKVNGKAYSYDTLNFLAFNSKQVESTGVKSSARRYFIASEYIIKEHKYDNTHQAVLGCNSQRASIYFYKHHYKEYYSRNIPRMIDYEVGENRTIVVYERKRAPLLTDIIDRLRLDDKIVILRQLLSLATRLERQSVWHGDIRIWNTLYDVDAQVVYLIDWDMVNNPKETNICAILWFIYQMVNNCVAIIDNTSEPPSNNIGDYREFSELCKVLLAAHKNKRSLVAIENELSECLNSLAEVRETRVNGSCHQTVRDCRGADGVWGPAEASLPETRVTSAGWEAQDFRQQDAPYISMVVATRNDDHGGDMLRRFQSFLDHLGDMCGRHSLNAELIVVEWNPDPDRLRLTDAVRWPKSAALDVRIVTVPAHIHAQYDNADKFPLFQMIAKNVGVRRARGEFVLATNVDLLFSDELCAFLADKRLDPACFYRIDRHDLAATSVPEGLDWEQRQRYCERRIVRVHGQHGTYAWGQSLPVGRPERLHTHACGDFTLMSRRKWLELRGYPEFHLWSIYLDGLLVHAAAAAGLRQVILRDPCRIYHIEHDLGWARTREPAKERPCLDYDREYLPQCRKMLAEGKPLDVNGTAWGLADVDLEETRPITPAGTRQGGTDAGTRRCKDDFADWINVLGTLDHRLYYRDQSAQTLSSLAQYAGELDPTVIVELGTLAGLSLRAWVKATDRAKIYAVDLSFDTLRGTMQSLPVDLSRVTLLEQDILKTDFSRLWTAQDRVIFFVDAHDLPNVPIMEHVLTKALPALPDGSLVIVDDLWFSAERLTQNTARAFLENRVLGEIDELQCFDGYFAPYHGGGSFMGFAEVIPLLSFVNRHGIALVHDPGSKHVHFVWKKEYLHRAGNAASGGSLEPEELCGSVAYHPLESVPAAPVLADTMRHVARLYRRRNLREVVENLSQALAQHPGDEGLSYGLAVCLARGGLLSQARDILARNLSEANCPRYRRLYDDLVQYLRSSEAPRLQARQDTPDSPAAGELVYALPLSREQRTYQRPARLIDPSHRALFAQGKSGEPAYLSRPLVSNVQEIQIVRHRDCVLHVKDEKQNRHGYSTTLSDYCEILPGGPHEMESAGPVLPWFYAWSYSWQHFVQDSLPVLAGCRDYLLAHPEVTLLIAEPTHDCLPILLQQLGLPNRVCTVPRDRAVKMRCRELLMPCVLPDPAMWNWPPELYRRIVGQAEENLTQDLLIYTSRSGCAIRRIRNEAEVIEYLRTRADEWGLELLVFDASKMSPAERVAAFRRARVVVGPHGGANYHVLYCRPGTPFIELCFYQDMHTLYNIATAVGADYWMLPVRGGRATPEAPLDIELLDKALRSAVGKDESVARVSVGARMRNSMRMAEQPGLTIFAMPKAFIGHNALIQKNAIRSWARLDPRPEIILFGDESGMREMAEEVGARHIPRVDRNEFGTPLVNKLFEAAEAHASHEILAYVNADMVLFQDFVAGVQKVQAGLPDFLLIGQRWDVPLVDEIDFDLPGWQQRLQRQMAADAMIHAESGLDYFVFRKGLWPQVPPFAIGRTAWDNWLVSDPHGRGIPVVDGSEFITAVHQDHDYGHMAGGRQEAWLGEEAERNRMLAGKTDRSGRTSGATWALRKGGELVKAEPRESWCDTAVYMNQRSVWLLEHANKLTAVDKHALAANKCEEAMMLMHGLLRRARRVRRVDNVQDHTLLAQRYVSCHMLLAQCYLKMGRCDQVTAVYTQLLEDSLVHIPPSMRDDITRLRDRSMRLLPPSAPPSVAEQKKNAESGTCRQDRPDSAAAGEASIRCTPPSGGARRVASKVSVVLACHDAQEFLPECLDSILAQTMSDWELHVLDDGSTDGTRRIIADYAGRDERIIPYYFDDNAGPYVRRNFAIERVAAPFIVIQDADDVMCPDKLERLHRAIVQDERLGVVGSFYRMFLDRYQGPDHAEDVILKTTHEEIIEDYRNGGICDYTWHGSAIIRKRLFDEIGPYDENPFSSDSFWLAKIAEYACRSDEIRLKNIPEFLTLRRMRADSQTGSLPSFDPRGRRAMFRNYRREKLSEVIHTLDADPTADVKAELRKSVCSDFIRRHEHLFEDWESQPLTARMAGQFMARIYSQFDMEQLVRCINTCGIVERLTSGIAQTVRAYDLVRGLAYFVLGLPDKSRLYLEREAQTHGTEAARAFCMHHLDQYDPQWTRMDRIAMVREALFGAEPFGRSAGTASAPLRCVTDRRSRHANCLSIVVSCGVEPSLWSQRVAALNAQTDKGFEVIVLGYDRDCGDVSTLLQDADFDCVVLERGEGLSPWRQKNAAVAHARGSHVAFLGEWVDPEPDFVERVVQRFAADNINGLRGRILSDGAAPVCFDLGSETQYAACDIDDMCVFPKDVFTSLGGFGEMPFMRGAFQLSYRIYTDTRIPARPILYCPDVVARYVGPRQERERLVDRSCLENHFCIDYLKRAGLLQNGDTYLTMTFFRFVSGLYDLPNQADERRFEHLLDNCLFFGQRFPQVALERAEAALAYRPDSLVARHIVGSLYAKLDRPGPASKLLDEILSSLEKLLALGRIDPARSEFTDYTDVRECYVGSCTLLAQCYLKMMRRDKTAAAYTRLLENRHVQMPESQRKGIERVCKRLLGLSDGTPPAVHPPVAPRDTMDRSAACAPPTPAMSHRADAVPTTLPPDGAETPAVSEAADLHAEARARLEVKYASMPGNAPAKHLTAVRLSEMYRRAGKTDKANALGLRAQKIKNLAAFERARQCKPHQCAHRPMIAEFTIIGRCTAGCIMCNYGPQGDALDLNRFKHLADDLLPAAHKVLFIGGEVLLHPDFYEMSEYANRFGIHLEMTTNLCTLAGKRAEAVRRFFGSVRVSTDGATKQMYESIRTRLSFDRLQANLRILAEIKRDRPDLKLQMAFVAMRRNIAELPDALEMVAGFGFDSASVSFVHVDAQLTLDDSLLFHRETANRYFDLARHKAKTLGLRLDAPNNFDLSEPVFFAPKKPTDAYKHCIRPWQRVRVTVNGDVMPCCRLLDLPMGNAFAEPFDRIWNGAKYRDLREAIATGSDRLPARCKHCELINGPTNPNDALLHVNRSFVAALKERLAPDAPEPRGKCVSRVSKDTAGPKVTVVTACHNSERFLAESVESVLRQSLPEWELLLLDDASTDGTRRIIEDYARRDARIKPFYFDTNAGPYVRRNFAIQRAGSDFIVIQDSDDLMTPTKLETLYKAINKDSRLAMVGSFYRTFYEEFKEMRYTTAVDLPLEHDQIAEQAATWQHGISHISAIIRKSMFDCIGGYDENPFGSDAFWSAKLAEYSRHNPDVRFKNLPEYLTLYRIHDVSQTQVLSMFDPRNRRIRYRSYCEYKLKRVREKMQSVGGTDVARELRACTCSDFLTRFKAEIIKWENEPLDPHVPENLLKNAVAAFNSAYYVNCVDLLNGVETLEPSLPERIAGFDLLRAMAFFALDMRGRSAACLEEEIANHDSLAARKFRADAFEQEAELDVAAWHRENAQQYNVGLRAVEREATICTGTAQKQFRGLQVQAALNDND